MENQESKDTKEALDGEIKTLTHEQAIFCLRALFTMQYVAVSAMCGAINLSKEFAKQPEPPTQTCERKQT